MKTNKYLALFALMLPVIALGTLGIYYMKFVENAPTVSLPITGYDPRNLLSGHYIEYRIDWNRADCGQFADKKCPMHEFESISKRVYIDEENVRAVERILNSGERDGVKVVFAYMLGRVPVSKGMTIYGVMWQDYVRGVRPPPLQTIRLPVAGAVRMSDNSYMEYRIDWDRADCWQFDDGQCPVAEFDTMSKRVFINEGDREDAKRAFDSVMSGGKNVEILFSYQQGTLPVHKGVLINGQDWQQYIR